MYAVPTQEKFLSWRRIYGLLPAVVCLVFPAVAVAQWQAFDSFADGNFSANPAWLADTNGIAIVTSDAGPATPTPTTTNTVRLKGTNVANTVSVTAVNTNAGPVQEWACWWGRRAQAATVANHMKFWVFANESNLESATVDGYAVRFGDDTGDDNLFLERIDNGAATTLITSSGTVPNGLTDIGFCVRVSWSNGNWVLYSSTLPGASGGGTNHLSDPSVCATVSQGSISNSTYVPTNGYLGLQFIHSTSANAYNGAEVDQVMVSNGVAAAATPEPEIAVLGTNLAEIVNGDSTPAVADGTEFGSWYYDAAVVLTNTFTITNSGTAALVLTGTPSVVVVGHGDFTVGAQPALTNIATNATTTFQIHFDPAAAGARTAVVWIANTDASEPQYNFLVRGTGVAFSVPSVTTSNMASIGTTNAIGGGAITFDGGTAVTNKGLCWNTTGTPTVDDSKTQEGADSNAFASTLTGLIPGQIYYVRAYAQNVAGSGYGGSVTFTALCFTVSTSSPPTGILDNQFTANWAPVLDATGYLLDVSTSATFSVAGVGGGLLISQYYEGSGSDKWIELYNASASAIDLTNLAIWVGLYSNDRRESWKTNGAPNAFTALTGTVAAGATFLLKNTSAAAPGYAVADQANGTVINFSGDDTVVLYTGSTYSVTGLVDSIGLTGTQLGSTSVVRRVDIVTGLTGTTDYAAADWTGYTVAAVDGASAGTLPRLGYHSTTVGTFVPGYEDRPVGDVTSYIVTGLQVGVTYYYRVRATNANCVTAHSTTQSATTVATGGGVTQLGATSPSNSIFILDGQALAGEYGVTAAVRSVAGLFTNLMVDADYDHLHFALQYSNRSTVVWTEGSVTPLFSNTFGDVAFTVEPEVFSNGYRVSGIGRNDEAHGSTNGNSGSGFAVMGTNQWTSFGISYFTNVVTVSNGYRLSFSDLTFEHRRFSDSGPQQWQLSYRQDGAGSYIVLTNGSIAGSTDWQTNTADLSTLPEVVGESTVEFRYDAWGAQEGSSNVVAGGLAIVGYNLDGAENFNIVVLQAMPEGTVILFTDNGWMVPENDFRTNESHFTTWTATTALAVGDVIGLDLVNMNNAGDQWCAYQVTDAGTNFLYAVNALHTNWQDTATSGETSALYPGLTNGSTAVAVPYENAYYTGTLTGTRAQLLAWISDPLNWTGHVNELVLPTNRFVVTDVDSGTNDVAWAVDNIGVSARIDTGTGADSTDAVILVYFDTDAGATNAGVGDLTSLTDDSDFLEQGATFSGPDAVSGDPYWVKLITGEATNWFDADFVAVLRPGLGGSGGTEFFGIDRDTPGALTPLTHNSLNNKSEQTAEFEVPWATLRDFAPAGAAGLLNDCDGDSVYVFAVAAVATNASALDDTSPPNDVGTGAGGIGYTNVWQLDLTPGFAEPTERPASVVFSNHYTSSLLTWSGGNGAFSIVLARKGSSVDAAPVDGVAYEADSTFGLGDEVGVSNYVVSVTNGSWCMIHGLELDVEYHVAVFEANGLGTCADYLSEPRRSTVIPTVIVLYSFDLVVDGDSVNVCWETASEQETAGFWVYRMDAEGQWHRIHDEMIIAQGIWNGGVGGAYCVADPGARPGETFTYKLVEVEFVGNELTYGPFERTAYLLKLTPPVRIVDDGVAIQWLSFSNQAYTIWCSTNLLESFSPIAAGVPATPPENVFTDSVSPPGVRFYRISVDPAE